MKPEVERRDPNKGNTFTTSDMERLARIGKWLELEKLKVVKQDVGENMVVYGASSALGARRAVLLGLDGRTQVVRVVGARVEIESEAVCQHDWEASRVCLNAAGTRVLFSTYYGQIEVRSIPTLQLLFQTAVRDPVDRVFYLRLRRRFCYFSIKDRSSSLSTVHKQGAVRLCGLSWSRYASVSPRGDLCFAEGNNGLRLVALGGGRPTMRMLDGPAGHGMSTAAAWSERQLAVGFVGDNPAGPVALWNLRSKAMIPVQIPQSRSCYALFHSEGMAGFIAWVTAAEQDAPARFVHISPNGRTRTLAQAAFQHVAPIRRGGACILTKDRRVVVFQ